MNLIIGIAAAFLLVTMTMPLASCSTSSGAAEESFVSETGVKYKLSNPASTKNTKAVYRFLCENFGKKIITGQQESTWRGSSDYEMDIVRKETGKTPAMRGLDYSSNDFKGVNARAKAWWDKGGLVSICWHVGIYDGGYREAQNDRPDFDLLLDETTPEHQRMIRKWDEAARALAELRDAGVVVLWRPFHELDGGWFWWGKGGPDKFKKLWRMMYKRYTEEFHLDNLIWVYGYSGEIRPGWYVGDEYCDIIGSDTYDGTTHRKGWQALLQVGAKNKPFTFHECGRLPSIQDFERDGCMWSWFMVWHTTWADANKGANLRELYNSDKVLTLEDIQETIQERGYTVGGL